MRKFTLAATAVLALSLSACAADDDYGSTANGGAATPMPTESALPPSSSDLQEASDRLTEYFSLRSPASATVADRLDQQEPFLTDPSVSPLAAYEDAFPEGQPMGVEDLTTKVVLGEPKVSNGSTVTIPFHYLGRGRSYTLVNGRIVPNDKGTPSYTLYEGEASLVKKNGKWLISDITLSSMSGGTGDGGDRLPPSLR